MKKRRNSQVADARKEQVLAAASRCFARAGFHKTTMPELAQEARMSIGNIYGYFENKESIIIALVTHIVEQMKSQMLETASRFTSSVGFLRAQVRLHVHERYDPENCILSAEVLAEVYRNETVAEAMRQLDSEMRELTARLCRADRPDLSAEEVRNGVNLLFMAIYGYAKSKALCPDLKEEASLAALDLLIDYLFGKKT